MKFRYYIIDPSNGPMGTDDSAVAEYWAKTWGYDVINTVTEEFFHPSGEWIKIKDIKEFDIDV